jgi:hypothetical protein
MHVSISALAPNDAKFIIINQWGVAFVRFLYQRLYCIDFERGKRIIPAGFFFKRRMFMLTILIAVDE